MPDRTWLEYRREKDREYYRKNPAKRIAAVKRSQKKRYEYYRTYKQEYWKKKREGLYNLKET